MEDISPKLLESCRKGFNSEYNKSKQIKKIINRIRDGTATLSDASIYSTIVGEILGRVLANELKLDKLPEEKLFWNIAQSVIIPLIKDNHDLVSICSKECQKISYKNAGVGIKVATTKINQDRLKGLLDDVCAEGITAEQLAYRLAGDVQNITESFYDDFAHENAERSAAVGLKTKVIRTVASSGCCAWCDGLAGVYDYDEVKPTGSDVWLRHVNCNCDITFSSEKVQEKVNNYKTHRQVSYKGKRK